jgi:hypothetical protein
LLFVPQSHNPQIYSFNEALFQTSPGWDWDVFLRDEDPQRFLVELLQLRPHTEEEQGQAAAGKGCCKAVGFKLFPGEWPCAGRALGSSYVAPAAPLALTFLAVGQTFLSPLWCVGILLTRA